MDEMYLLATRRRDGLRVGLGLLMLLAGLALLPDRASAAERGDSAACTDTATAEVDAAGGECVPATRPSTPADRARPAEGDRSANPADPGRRLEPLLRQRFEDQPGSIVREDRRKLPA